MTLRIIEISAPESASDKIKDLAERYEAIDIWHRKSHKNWFDKDQDSRETTRILINVHNQQDLIDALTRVTQKNENWRILLLPVEASLPRGDNEADTSQDKKKKTIKDILKGSVTREELMEDISKGGQLSMDYVLLVFLSAIVAGIGLIQSDVAVVIGAMVIAPLLGPNLALAFGAALGDKKLITQSIQTNIVGLCLTLVIAVLMGLFVASDTVFNSTEIMNRTNVSYGKIFLALAAGGAAVLSLTTGVSSALVGVMVAVALLPPAVSFGILMGKTEWDMALSAGLLLLTNIVSINLAALSVFRLKGIKPRTWYEEKAAKKASRINAAFMIGALIILAILITLKSNIN
ncbi:MAG: TIGR00341 family protein [Pseudomonadota bacterium]